MKSLFHLLAATVPIHCTTAANTSNPLLTGEILFCERNPGRDYAGHYYANFGYECGNENFRLYGADGGRLAIYSSETGSVRTLLEDAAGAVRFVRCHAGDYGIDPQRIGITGSSAGGCHPSIR